MEKFVLALEVEEDSPGVSCQQQHHNIAVNIAFTRVVTPTAQKRKEEAALITNSHAM